MPMTGPGSLLPREHGAYAELGFPLATGLGLAVPSASTVFLALAAVALFLAQEPVAVLLGVRGERLRSQKAPRARWRSALLLTLGVALGIPGALLGGEAVRTELIVPGVAALLLFPLVMSGKQKTFAGEILVVTVFAALVLPLAVGSGVSRASALWAAGVWWTSFFLGTLEVHAIKARHSRQSRYKKTQRSHWARWASPVASWGILLLCLYGAIRGQGDFQEHSLALLPPALSIMVLAILAVHPRHLKRVGWTLVGANSLTLAVLLLS